MFLKNHNNTAITWKNQQFTYKSLIENTDYYAGLFSGTGANRVAIFSENRPEWAFAFYSAWQNDCTAVPIDFMSSVDEVVYILNDCRPEVVFCSESVRDTVEAVQNDIPYKPLIFFFEEIPSLPEDKPEAAAFPEPDVYKTAVIIYTSGTTGSPKGVMLSYDNLLANIEQVHHKVPIFTAERNVMVLLPLHHIFPLLGSLIAPLYVGTTVAFCPSLTAKDIMETLQNNKVAIIIGVPRLYNLLRNGIREKIDAHLITRALYKTAKKLNSRGFSRTIFKSIHKKFGGHVDYLVTGGAKIEDDTASDFKTWGFEMLEGYGMTEAAPMITFTRPGKVKIGSAGHPLPTLEVKTIDGEIVAKGRNIMMGYYNRENETNEVLKDGWLHTGDLGHIDDDGRLYVTGRKKEILVLSSGKNINPIEIENKIASMSDIIEEIGVFMKNDGIQAAIYPNFKKAKENHILNLMDTIKWEIIDKYNQKTSPSKRIKKVILVKEELPKTRLGKIQRFKLTELTDQLSSPKKRPPEPNFEEYHVIKKFLQEYKAIDIYPDDDFEIDLGLDSLDKVTLQTFLQSTFGVETRDDLLIQYPTLEKLSNYIKETKVKISVGAVRWKEILKEKIDINLPKSWFTHNLLKNLSKFFLQVYFRLKGEGTENLPNGPFILVPNHQSFFDGLFVAVFLKNKLLRRTYFYAKEKHVRNKCVKFIANRHNVIVMDINKDLKLSLQKMAKVLEEGRNLIIFPEGTRSADGSMGNFKKTFAILSRELNIPVVPVSINGAFEALPRGSVIPRPWKKINIRFLNPVYPGEHTYNSLLKEVYNRIRIDLTPGGFTAGNNAM